MILFKLSIMIFLGLVLSNLIEKIGLPRVSAYFIVGLLLGPSVFGLITYAELDSLNIINQVALACVGFGIGKSFNYNTIKHNGLKIIILTLIESLVTSMIVFLVLFFVFRQSFVISLLLGAIASATAPAVPLLVLKQFKADGVLSRTIYPIVGLDDITCVIVFGISLTVARFITEGADVPVAYAVLTVSINIFVTVVAGVVIGYIFSLLIKELKKDGDILVLTIGIASLGVGMALLFELELIILCMTIGTIVSNFVPAHEKIFDNLSINFMPPVFLVFFGISAAALDIEFLFTIGAVGVAYIAARGIGKILGSFLGAQAAGFPSVVKKYLGISILSQAGVGIGLAVIVKHEIGEVGNYIYTIAITGVLVYEVIGPILTKFAIKKAGEINVK